MTLLRVLKQELNYVVSLATPAYPLVANWVPLNAGLFKKFRALGIRPDGISWESRSSHPKDFEVVCFLHDWTAVVRLRLMSVDIWSQDRRFLRDSLSPVAWLTNALEVMTEVGADTAIESQTISFAYHGSLQGDTIADCLGRYSSTAPPETSVAGITFRSSASEAQRFIDLQTSFEFPGPGGTFVNLRTLAATKELPADVFESALRFREEALRSLDLELQWDTQ